MSADLVIASQLWLASVNLNGAVELDKSRNRVAAYLCSQAAEQLILAVLTAENKHGGVRHQFDAMVELVPDANPLKPSLRELEGLSAYATSYRYATPAGKIPKGPSSEELAKHLERVRLLLARLVEHFGVDLGKEGAPARTTTPIR